MNPNARWIWHGEPTPNTFVGFARTLHLDTVPERALLTLAADTKYKLYVNGSFVSAGPAPFRKPLCRTDVHDLAPCLRAGNNLLFVLAHFIGVNVKYNNADRPGVIASLAIDGSEDLVTDAQWRAFPIAAWTQETPRKNWAIEFVEELHTSHPDFRILQAFAGDDYATGTPAPTAAELLADAPAAEPVEMGDITFRERGVPPLRWRREDLPHPAQILRLNGEVYNLPDTPVRLCHEHVTPAWDQDIYTMTRGDATRVRRRRGEPGYGLIYDMRRMCAGDVAVEVTVDRACTLDLCLAEELKDGRPNIWRNGGLYFARYHLSPGRNRLRYYHHNGHRYIYLVLKDLEGEATIHRVTTHHRRADIHADDTFRANDRTLEAVYGISRRSLLLNTQAVATDCNTREQGAYWGDNIWILDSVGHLGGDFSHLREMCRVMTDETAATGTLSASLYGLGAPLWDYCLIAVDYLRRYYRYTGDLATLRDHLPTAERIVDDFRAKIDDSGLIFLGESEDQYALRQPLLFLDHPGLGWHPRTTTGILRDNYSAGINLYYLQALRALRDVAGQLDEADATAAERDALRQRLRERFLCPRTGLISDSWTPDGGRRGYSQLINALAVTTGVLTGDEARHALETVTRVDRHPWVAQGTPYTYFALCEALIQAGLVPMALDTIAHYWTPMLERGATTTWEAFGGENHDSLNHAWSAPLPYLLRVGVMGLQPTAPGYRELELKPCLAPFRSFALSCRIPAGPVRMGWEAIAPRRFAITVTLPEGTAGSLVIGDQRTAIDGSIETEVELP